MMSSTEHSFMNGYSGNNMLSGSASGPEPAATQLAQEEVVSKMQTRGQNVVVCRTRFTDKRTRLILRAVFSEFCPSCEKEAKQIEREISCLKKQNPPDEELVRKVSHLIVQFITETDQLTVNLQDFTQQKWSLHGGNMHSEFSKVAQETFKDTINWGRIIMFLGFAISFSVFLEEGIVRAAADSVLEWTHQLVEEDLGHFYCSHQGWEGFADYLETAVRATRRSQAKRKVVSDSGLETDEERKASLWQGAFAAGAVAVGAMAAFTLRQAFS